MSQPGYGNPNVYGTPNGAYPPPPKSNGMAITGLILAIVGLVISWIPVVNFVAIPLAITGLILGIVGISKAKNGIGGTGLGVAATIVGGIALLSTIASLIVYAVFITAASESLSGVSEDFNKMSGQASDQILAEDLRVEFGQFQGAADSFGFVESSLQVTVTNTSSDSHRFSFSVEARDASGALIGTDIVITDMLDPGQSVTKDAFQFVDETDIEPLSTATFEAVDASEF